MSLDDVELARLEETVNLAKSLFGDRTRGLVSNGMPLAAELASAEHRIEALENEGLVSSAEKERKDAERLQNAAVLFLVQQEINLTHAEQQSFGEFLAKDHFTKGDFGPLDNFYASAWDRLSERGKSEMSHRVWEGIREGEYEFTDLPKNVREKEMERLYGFLADPTKTPENLKQIPETDREEFIAAMDNGEKDKAAEILNRGSFKENVSKRVVTESEQTQSKGAQYESGFENELEGQEQTVSPKSLKMADNLEASKGASLDF